jgi:hypothetical protein
MKFITIAGTSDEIMQSFVATWINTAMGMTDILAIGMAGGIAVAGVGIAGDQSSVQIGPSR